MVPLMLARMPAKKVQGTMTAACVWGGGGVGGWSVGYEWLTDGIPRSCLHLRSIHLFIHIYSFKERHVWTGIAHAPRM